MKVLEEESNKMIVEFTGETHTICNLLRKRLMQDDNVTAAAYDITHPIIGQPEFEIRSSNPRKALVTAAENMKKETLSFKEELTKKIK